MGMSTAGAILSLDANYGSGHASNWPSTLTLRLYVGDPRDGGVECTDAEFPGYVPFDIANNSTNFPDADVDGSKSSDSFAVFTTTADWTAIPTHAALCDDADVLEVFERDTGATVIPVSGSTIEVPLFIFYDEVT